MLVVRFEFSRARAVFTNSKKKTRLALGAYLGAYLDSSWHFPAFTLPPGGVEVAPLPRPGRLAASRWGSGSYFNLALLALFS